MNICRIDFEFGGDKLTFFYDEDETTKEEAEKIVSESNGCNDSLKDKSKGFFIPTSKIDGFIKEVVDLQTKLYKEAFDEREYRFSENKKSE